MDDHGIQYEDRNIVTNNPTVDELTSWINKSGMEIKKIFNSSGIKYRELNLKDKLPTMTHEEKIALLSTDGMLVKRPIIVGEDFVLVGFKEAEWTDTLTRKS